jgi:hypothetical protein
MSDYKLINNKFAQWCYYPTFLTLKKLKEAGEITLLSGYYTLTPESQKSGAVIGLYVYPSLPLLRNGSVNTFPLQHVHT